MKSGNAHEFAVYIAGSKHIVDTRTHTLTLLDTDLINRIVSILRLKEGRSIILFDESFAYSCAIREITKKSVVCHIGDSVDIMQQSPQLHLLLPILEREALEDTVYMATVFGVTSLHLVATEKSRRALTEKDYLRLEKIAIAAAEQSKQFCLPKIETLVTLENFLDKKMVGHKDSVKLWCDISGAPLLTQLTNRHKNYLVTLGPEGDYAHEEKEHLRKYFLPVKLGSTILRAKDAASLLMGILRIG